MILVDTSVWVAHFRQHNPLLEALLLDGEVRTHPFVIGELACGNLKNQNEILGLLHALPQVTQASHEEILVLIDRHRLMGTGLGLIDVHLLGAALISHVNLWTIDRRLKEIAGRLGIGY